jgi:hypothetical protein
MDTDDALVWLASMVKAVKRLRNGTDIETLDDKPGPTRFCAANSHPYPRREEHHPSLEHALRAEGAGDLADAIDAARERVRRRSS